MKKKSSMKALVLYAPGVLKYESLWSIPDIPECKRARTFTAVIMISLVPGGMVDLLNIVRFPKATCLSWMVKYPLKVEFL